MTAERWAHPPRRCREPGKEQPKAKVYISLHDFLRKLLPIWNNPLRLLMAPPLAFGSHKRTATVPQPGTRLKRLVREALEDAWAPAFGADLSGLPQVLQQLAGQPLHDGEITKLVRYSARCALLNTYSESLCTAHG